MIKSNSIAFKFAFISVLLWSTVATAFKISLKYLSPEELVFYASLSSFFVLFFVIIIQKKLHLVSIHVKTNSLMTLILGSINPFLYYLVLFKAYDLLPAQEAQAINYTWALMLAFLSVPLLKQKLTFGDIVAGIICYFGVLIISTKGEPFSLNFSNLDGVLLALLSTVLWALYWIFNTKSKSDPVVSLFSNFLFALPMIGIYLYFTQTIVFPDIEGILAAIYVGFFEMGITFLFWLKAMQTAENTAKIANLIFISPFLSLILIYFVLNEPIFISTLFGLSFIILGLVIQQKSK
ncbi:DMT family transporter [Arcobacter sp. LA11]|uniref:DMT family transporter n=1 Tax=Arcobacter sp. LA11 TaxID=1898176 RepID=UPI0009335C88|nr:DMT family transporter [Arcobacter sp. LA11]